jgi:hypothetical protein
MNEAPWWKRPIARTRPWGTIGFVPSVELGCGIAIGFALVGMVGWVFVELLR